MMSVRKRVYPYHVNLLLAFDNLLFAIFGWNCDCSGSAGLGEIMWNNYKGRPIPSHRFHQSYLQKFLDKIEKDHCLKAYATELKNRNITIPIALSNRTKVTGGV